MSLKTFFFSCLQKLYMFVIESLENTGKYKEEYKHHLYSYSPLRINYLTIGYLSKYVDFTHLHLL